MGQTILDRNTKFYSDKNVPATSKSVTVLTSIGALAALTVLMLDPLTGKYVLADTNTLDYQVTDAPTFSTLTNDKGWVVLLEAIDTTGGDVVAEVGASGGIDDDDIIFAGAELTTVTELAKVILAMNNIYVNKKSNSVTNV